MIRQARCPVIAVPLPAEKAKLQRGEKVS
ncbi:MAG: hypothetical protein R3C68_02985 [Myxococcota bacterium]